MATILITIIALIWLVPLTVCLVLAMVSWISLRFRRFCSFHLFGPEQPEPDVALRPKGEGASSSLPSIARAPEPYASPDAERHQGAEGCYPDYPRVGNAQMKDFRIAGSIALRGGLSLNHFAASNSHELYSPRLGPKGAQEPDIVMANAGDPEGRSHMVEAAIADYEGCDRD